MRSAHFHAKHALCIVQKNAANRCGIPFTAAARLDAVRVQCARGLFVVPAGRHASGISCGEFLLHRAASAIITGDQFHAAVAVVLVHSFSEKKAGWDDYEAFIRLFGVQPEADVVQRVTSASSIPLFAAWVSGNPAFLDDKLGSRVRVRKTS